MFDSKGKELKVAHNLPHPNYSEDGLVTQNMESHWNIAAETIRTVVEASRQYGEVKAVGVTGQGDGLGGSWTKMEIRGRRDSLD